MLSHPSVIVIGAGIGGIAAATHLARQGLRVTVLEKNSRPGGRFDRFCHHGHHFDAGPTLLVMRLLYEAEFAALGTSLSEVLELIRVDPTYHLVFDDASQLTLTSDVHSMYRQLEAIEPGSFNGFLRYIEEGHRHYHRAIDRLVNRDFRKATDFFCPANFPLLFCLKPLVRHYQNMGNYFRQPRLKAAFSFQDVYMGLSPFDAPATFSMMPYTELAHGVWYPRGGMYRIVEVLMELALQAGVEFEFNRTVERITIYNNRASGVVLSGGHLLTADAVIANADLPYVYQNLLPPGKRATQMTRRQFSCSTISFFWGVDQIYPQLPPHTLFLADDYRENFISITRDFTLPVNPSLYIHAPVRLDPSMAPPGSDSIIAIVPVGHIDDQREQPWGEIRDKARQEVFKRLAMLGITDLENHIKFEVNFTPLSWQKRYNLMKGATHGLSHNLTQLGYFRPSNRHPEYPNLYFVGASTRPGTGVPTAMVSARHVANRLMEDFGVQSI